MHVFLALCVLDQASSLAQLQRHKATTVWVVGRDDHATQRLTDGRRLVARHVLPHAPGVVLPRLDSAVLTDPQVDRRPVRGPVKFTYAYIGRACMGNLLALVVLPVTVEGSCVCDSRLLLRALMGFTVL